MHVRSPARTEVDPAFSWQRGKRTLTAIKAVHRAWSRTECLVVVTPCAAGGSGVPDRGGIDHGGGFDVREQRVLVRTEGGSAKALGLACWPAQRG